MRVREAKTARETAPFSFGHPAAGTLLLFVIPAKAGIHLDLAGQKQMDSGFRRNDESRSAAGYFSHARLPPSSIALAAPIRPARMTLRLSRGEFWLLANAVDHGLPLPILTLPEWVPGTRSMNTIYVVLNRQGHGLALPSLVETLLQVSHNGWIEFGRARSEQRIRPSADDLAGC